MANSLQVVILGAGNVARFFGSNIQDAGHKVTQIWNRTKKTGQALANQLEADYVKAIKQITDDADLYLVAVSDDVIQQVAQQLSVNEGVVVHTSGIAPLDVLAETSQNIGVFYPLQTISSERTLTTGNVPLLVQGINNKVNKLLQNLGDSLNNPVYPIETTEQRQRYHLAAVFVNNFTNHQYYIAYQLLNDYELDFNQLMPLLNETVAKLEQLNPDKAQTGPAVRDDRQTIETHLRQLKKYPDYAKIYNTLTESIQEHHISIQEQDEEGHFLKRMAHVTTFVFDMDGVLTDGMGIVTKERNVLRKLNSKDAYGLQLAAQEGYRIVVLSGAFPVGVEKRLEKLGVQHILTGSADKLDVYRSFCDKHGISNHEVLHMADDIPDLKVFKKVGIATCPKDAAPELLQCAHYISDKKGGAGAVRDVIEKVLKVQNNWLNEGAHIW